MLVAALVNVTFTPSNWVRVAGCPEFVTVVVFKDATLKDPKTLASSACEVAVVFDGETPLKDVLVPRVHPVNWFVDLPVYWITSFTNKPEEESTFSIIIKPLDGNSVASVKSIEVAESVIAPFKVVESSKVVIAKPPTGAFTFWSLIWSFTTKSPSGNKIFNVVFEAVTNGLSGKNSCVGNSVLAGFAFCKPSGSAPCALGSNCGCFGSTQKYVL